MGVRFEGRKILVFGASSGIGRACAIRLGAQGASVVLVGRNMERLKETAHFIPEGRSAILPCDVSDFNAAQTVVKDAVALDGVKLDGCVFSVGITMDIPIASVKEQMLVQAFQTNLFALYGILRSFSSRRTSQDGASFVSISSMAAIEPNQGQSIYAGTKAGINAMTRVAAQELAKRGIRVNAVCPYLVDTPMTAKYIGHAQERIQEILPLGKILPEDIADTVLFLLGDESKKITAQAIEVTSGSSGGDAYSLFK